MVGDFKLAIFSTHPHPWRYKNNVRPGEGVLRVNAIVDKNDKEVATTEIGLGPFHALWEFYQLLTPEQKTKLGG